MTDPTCTAKGYTTYTCTVCGRSYKGDETTALGHDYQDGTCIRCGKLQPVPGDLANIDFTDPAAAEQFEVVNQASTAIRAGEGLYMITTTDAFEDCNAQISTFNPKDVVKVPVEGDWTATLKFDFSTGSAANGYYQFFGFYAAAGDDYQNLAGIRGGDQAMQNFLRVDGTITADTDGVKSAPGLASNGTYWWRIAKEDTTYTCYRSDNGTAFTEMFSYADTGIEADSLILDAYTGMTEGYEFTVESLRFGEGEGDIVTPNPDPEPDPTSTLPENLSVEPSETNNIPAAIDLYSPSGSGYHLYLPGNTDVANCFLSWEGGLKATVDGQSYASGELPVPAVGATKTISFNNGTKKTFQVTTYQGSESIPPIFIEIDESQGTISAMNSSKNNSCSGVIYLDGEEHELDKMKGRGNATWSQAVEKRPYNITLGKKVESVLGIEMPEKNKKFSLLANIADRSLLRNKIGFDIAYEMGIGLDSVSVDLWMNGVYYGVYQFMAKNDAFNTDDGYTVENDNYKEPPISEGGDPSFDLEGLNTVNKPNLADYEHNRISVKAIGDNLLPNGETDEELARVAGEIQVWMQDMWDAIRSADGYNDEGKYYTEYIDITSWAKMYLMQEFVKNFDANAGSLKFYREATGEDDKMFAGPLWDLDNALGSTQINGYLGTQVDQTDASGWFMNKLSEDKTSIYKTVGKHDDFKEEVYRVYDEYKYLFDNASAQVVELAEEMADSAAMNFKRITRENYNTVNYSRSTVKSAGTAYEQTYKQTSTWQDYVDNLETFTRVRAKFLSDNLPNGIDSEPPVEAGTLPANLSVEPSETNNIPAAIDLYCPSNSGWGGSSSDHYLYLPGNTDAEQCFFSWTGGLKGTVDGETYASGEMPVPAVGETKTITFTSTTGSKTFQVTTYQGSDRVKAMFIEIDESQGTISAMNNDSKHDTECSGIIYIDGEEHVLDKMKGRGNATWSQAKQKRPYNITLGKKVSSILGIEMPDKTKKFSLLANIADRSLLRNKVGYDIAYEMGIGLDSASVDLWMNGKYLGLYLVVPKNDSFVTDGGYAVENDNYKEPPISEGGDPSFDLEGLNTVNKPNLADYEHNRISVKKIGDDLLPNGETDEELARVAGEIQAWMQDMWDAIRSEDGYNSKGKYYTEYIDITSWAKMYLMQEFAKGFDANAGSLLFHRDGTADSDKMFAGPLWDLDNALGSTQINSLLGNQVDQTDASGWFMRNLSDDKTSIFKTVGQHEDFMEEVSRVYNRYAYLFDNAPAQVEALAEEIADSAEMNYKKVTQESYNTVNYSHETVKSAGTAYEQTYKATNTWQDYVDNLETFTRVRAKFLRDNMPEAPECEHSYKAVVTDPTCTEAGYTTYTCSVCGDSYKGNEVAALGHDYEEVVTKPTCVDGGYTTYTCSVCGDSYKGNETEATGHKWDDGVVTKKPTPEEDGVMTFTCTVCGATMTKKIPITGPDCPSDIFSDVPGEDHWAHEGIDYAIEKGLMNGTGNNLFKPLGTLTRAELVTILYRAEGSPAAAYKGTFKDVADGQWYTAAIEWAAANGVVKGVGDGTNFDPSGVITREQIATILYRYDGEPKVEGDLKAFPDAGTVSDYASAAMIWANQEGIINGVTENGVAKLAPKASATREQIASIIMRYLEAE